MLDEVGQESIYETSGETSGTALTQNEIQRARLLKLEDTSIQAITLRKSRALSYLAFLRNINPGLRAYMLDFCGKKGVRGNSFSQAEHQQRRIQIQLLLEEEGSWWKDNETNEEISTVPMYAHTYEEACELQAIIFLIKMWQCYTHPNYGVIPTELGALQKIGYFMLYSRVFTFRNKSIDSDKLLRPISDIMKKNEFLSPQGKLKNQEGDLFSDSFQLLGALEFSPENVKPGVAMIEEAMVLDGWWKERGVVVFGEPPGSVLDAFYIKHAPIFRNAPNEITIAFRNMFPNYRPSAGVLQQAQTVKTNGHNKRTKNVLAGVPATVEQITREIPIVLLPENITHHGIYIRGCPDGHIAECTILSEGGEEVFELKVENEYIDFHVMNLDPEKSYSLKIRIKKTEGNQDRPLFERNFQIISTILQYCKINAPSISRQVSSDIIRWGKSIQIQDLITNWGPYEDVLMIGLREKGNPQSGWVYYNQEDTIDFRKIKPGNYEVAFFPQKQERDILFDDQVRKTSPLSVRIVMAHEIQGEIPSGSPVETPKKRPEEDVSEFLLNLGLYLDDENSLIGIREEARGEFIFDFNFEGRAIHFTYGRNGETLHGHDANLISKERRLLLPIIKKRVQSYLEAIDLGNYERIQKKIQQAQAYVYLVFEGIVGPYIDEHPSMLRSEETIESFTDKDRGYYKGIAMLQPWAREYRALMEKNLNDSGVHMNIRGEKTDNSGFVNSLVLSFSLASEASVSGTIRSQNHAPYFQVEIDPSCSDRVAGLLRGLLEKCFIIFGYFGQQKLLHPEKNSKKELSYTEYLRKPLAQKYGSSRLKMTDIEKVYASFGYRNGKFCKGFGSDHGSGLPYYEIHQGYDLSALESESPNLLVVMKDETLSSLPSGIHGNPYVYTLIQTRPRLQKYLISRILATISGKEYKGKSPLTGEMKDAFTLFWSGLQIDKEEWIGIAENSKTQAIDYKIENNIRFLDGFLASLRRRDVQISYRRPYLMPLGEFRELHEQVLMRKN